MMFFACPREVRNPAHHDRVTADECHFVHVPKARGVQVVREAVALFGRSSIKSIIVRNILFASKM